MINSYSSIFNIGHKALENLFAEQVLVEEKVDGSQLSFAIIEGELHMRSKGAVIIPQEPEPMFKNAADYVLELYNRWQLKPDTVYRCEYLKSPSHNTLC